MALPPPATSRSCGCSTAICGVERPLSVCQSRAKQVAINDVLAWCWNLKIPGNPTVQNVCVCVPMPATVIGARSPIAYQNIRRAGVRCNRAVEREQCGVFLVVRKLWHGWHGISSSERTLCARTVETDDTPAENQFLIGTINIAEFSRVWLWMRLVTLFAASRG